MFGKRLRELRTSKGYSMDKLIELYNKKYDAKMNKSTLSRYENGLQTPIYTVAVNLADFFGVSVDYISGGADAPNNSELFPSPNVTKDYTTFPVIGDIAAGYDHTAIEDWSGEVVDIPNSYLKGRDYSDFFVLRVLGESMYPTYQEGDLVLILKQTTANYSGQVVAIMYEDNATLKKVEFINGEDWLKLVPINANFPPKIISGEDLQYCRVLGIPRMLIREIDR